MGLNKQQLEARLRQGGQGTEMSRSKTLGAEDPRHRRGAQAQVETPLAYAQAQFVTNTAGEVELRLVSGEPLRPVASVDALAQAVSSTPTQGEVQAISDKVDELIAAMKTAGHALR